MTITRTVMKYGGYSLLLTLPKYWTQMHGIQRRDELSLEIRRDGSLLIKPPNQECQT